MEIHHKLARHKVKVLVEFIMKIYTYNQVEFRGVGGSENDKFPKGRGVTQTGFFTGGLK